MIAEAGIGFDDSHLPLLVRALYSTWPLKLIVLLRNPVDRLVSAYWSYDHYKTKYGATSEVSCRSCASCFESPLAPVTRTLMWHHFCWQSLCQLPCCMQS